MRPGIDVGLLIVFVFAFVLAMLAHEYKHERPQAAGFIVVISRDGGLP